MASYILGLILLIFIISTISSAAPDYAAFKEVDSNPKHKRDVEGENNEGCATKISTIQPKIAKNTNGEMRTIVSAKNKSIDIKTCVSESGTCKANNVPQDGQIAQCQQKFRVRKYLILDNDGNIAEDSLLFPYGCECQITP